MNLEDFFGRVYDVLMETCEAPKSLRTTFICELAGDNPTHQLRFGGALGFGGKFLFPQFSLTCYPTDVTDETREIIRRGNEALAALRREYVAALHDAAEAL